MANMDTFGGVTINKKDSAGLSPSVVAYYNKRLLENAKAKLVHQQFARPVELPKNAGGFVSLRRFVKLPEKTQALGEGLVPDGAQMQMSEVTIPFSMYGDYVAHSEIVMMATLDLNSQRVIDEVADAGGRTLDTLMRDKLAGSVQDALYAGTATARAGVKAGDKLTSDLVRKAVMKLKKTDAPLFSGKGGDHYVAIVGPESWYDLTGDPLWLDVSKYSDRDKIYNGEIGKLFGVRFVETSRAKVFAGAGTGGVDVAVAFVFGRDAYGAVRLEGGNLRTIVKGVGSAGAADPLDQVGTVGWKAAWGGEVLDQGRILRIEHAA